ARRRIAPRLATVAVIEPDPARRVRVAARARVRDAARLVAGRAAIGRVAGGARARIGARLERVPRGEPGAVHARAHRIGQPHRGADRRRGAAMAAGAEALTMAALAQIPRRRGARAVLAQPVAVVREVARGQRAFGLEVAVAGAARARGGRV